ncbi:MAG: ParA family protein [Methanotrichaceae archaeon]
MSVSEHFLEEDRIEELWLGDPHTRTVYGSIEPLLRGVGDILDDPYVEEIEDRIHLLAGDLSLSRFEDELSQQWPLCLDRKERAFRVISAFWRLLMRSAEKVEAEIILVDLGPNLGAINRSALVASDYLVVPLVPDLFSIQGLRNLGPTVRRWRTEWKDRLDRNPVRDLILPSGRIEPIGYIVMQHAVRLNRPVKAYERWMARIPKVYAEEVMGQEASPERTIESDPNRLGQIKHYQSMMPMAQEAHKPIFHLLPADGAIGSHYKAVQDARENFRELADEIAKRSGVDTGEKMFAYAHIYSSTECYTLCTIIK